MSFFAQLGKPLLAGSAMLTSGTLSAVALPASTGAFLDLYTVHITSTEPTGHTVTLSDGITTLTYITGGAAGGNNVPIFDQGAVPVRFKKATAITATSTTLTTGTVQVLVRALVSAT